MFLYTEYFIINPYDAYCQYLALKKHFTDPKYDYFKYNRKVRTSVKAYEARNDKLLFLKLAKQSDVEKFCVANFVYGKSTWLGDFSTETYIKWKKRNDALTHFVMEDCEKLQPRLIDNIAVRNNQHPLLLKLLIGGTIGIETVVILNELAHFFEYWDNHITDRIIWPSVKDKCLRYKPFVEFDKPILKQKIFLHFKDGELPSV